MHWCNEAKTCIAYSYYVFVRAMNFIFSSYNQNQFLTSPEWFFTSGGVWFDSGDVALTREMSGVCDGFYVSRGQKPNWTNVSRGTPKPNHRLRLPRVSTKLNQHLPSIKTKPCVHLPSNQNQIILTPPEYQNQTYLHLPSDKTIPWLHLPRNQNKPISTSPE